MRKIPTFVMLDILLPVRGGLIPNEYANQPLPQKYDELALIVLLFWVQSG